ncbi:MAG: FAD:protein FMN transferase [Planctomycetes bacterium]|nr:FAD:protein FMN transferase [Planctomycetota bacterium]
MIALLAGLLGAGCAAGTPLPESRGEPVGRHEFVATHMATRFRIVIAGGAAGAAREAAAAAFARIAEIERVASDYRVDSEVQRLDAHAGLGPGPVSEDLFQLLTLAVDVSRRSGGAFDVTVGPFVQLWRRSRRQRALPSERRLAECSGRVGYRLIDLDPDRRAVELRRPGMRIDLGGIAKGYAVDEALATLRERGFDAALVDGGGDVAIGASPGGSGWRIESRRDLTESGARFELANAAVATSGDTQQFVEIDGRRYSHIIDPRTGLGVTHSCAVTVVVSDGERWPAARADAWASALSVLEPDRALVLVEELPGTDAMIIDADGRTRASSGFPSPVDAPDGGDG